MQGINELKKLINHFNNNISYYKNTKNSYNEHSCRTEYIDPFLNILGWDVSNSKGLAPQYREVLAENYSTQTDRPDYSLTLRGVTKFFVEAKKPSVDICKVQEPALQARKYGWNANHKIAVLTNFEYLIIYDTTYTPSIEDRPAVARYRIYHYLEYVEKFDEIKELISRESVYSGVFDKYFTEKLNVSNDHKLQVDDLFLKQINEWRVSLSNELFNSNEKYNSLDVLNDVIQEFINQIVFLRICEDKNLPLYHNLEDTMSDLTTIHSKLEGLLRSADSRYNSGIFSGESIIFDLSSDTIIDLIKGLYYPQSPYLFNIIEPNMLGRIYELFLAEQLVVLEDGSIGLTKKKDYLNRSVVTTPIEIVKYMVEKTLSNLCKDKTPTEILKLRIADIACGSGIYLEEAFSFLQSYCVNWYMKYNINYLDDMGNGKYKLPLEDKKNILCSCIYGIDIDIHAVEVAKFSLLIKLIEDETAPTVNNVIPILPDLMDNIFHGNALINEEDLDDIDTSLEQLISIVPFDWNEVLQGEKFDAIIGNPPYVKTEEMHLLLTSIEFNVYKKKYETTHKQFDKYFVFLEQAINSVKNNGFVCFIVPNKFFKIASGSKLRKFIASKRIVMNLDDFGDAQLFGDKTIYSAIILMEKCEHEEFIYSSVESIAQLWSGEGIKSMAIKSDSLSEDPWKLSTDLSLLRLLNKLDQIAVPLKKHAEIFNGIQTSAERPVPVYWFTEDEIQKEKNDYFEIKKDDRIFSIEKDILKLYFKPTNKKEKGLNSYSILKTDKYIIFPYDTTGKLIPLDVMKNKFSGTYEYLLENYKRLVPKTVSKDGKRDVPDATAETWYQYGRTQALTSFSNTNKLIVGVLSQDPMYIYDDMDMLISSGGTAGYCAISEKNESPYALEYIQAWLSNPITEKIIRMMGSEFEGGFVARGTFLLQQLPFIELDFDNDEHSRIYSKVIETTREIYKINKMLARNLSKNDVGVINRKKDRLILKVEKLIETVYQFGIDEEIYET